MRPNLLTSVFTLIIMLFSQLTFAQGNGPCNTSQPRPITGNQHPCPGSIETYCIDNSRNYTSFEWDVPRAHAGNPPTGWEILSGQGTSCVTVRVGTKSGTMKVKVTDPICGTKVATLPVKPAKGFIVDVAGPDSVCVNTNQTYTATVADSLGRGNGNGNGQVKGSFSYNWTVPAGWVIVSGQGTSSITVTPSSTGGQVSVTATFAGQGGKGNNGNGVGGFKGYCNTTASDAINVKVNNNCGSTPPPCPVTAQISGPATICLFADEPFVYTVNATAGATYTWSITNATIISGQGTNSVEVVADQDAGPGQISVVVATSCGSATASMPFTVVEDCDLINPLPVELLSFTGKATAAGIALNWSTASEKNNDRFEVERSADGRSFEKVGTVKGNGTTSSQKAYSFTDKAAPAGVNYYRLRQVDFDGKSELSKIIALDAKATQEKAMSLYPNPATDAVFHVKISNASQQATLQIMDMSGRVLHSRQVNNTKEVAIDGRSLGMRPGLYLISLKEGTNVSVEKLIVK